MKPHEEILIKQKDFIEQVAKGNLSPDKSNDNVKEVLAAYNEIDTTVEVLAECATCQNVYQNSFKIILAYCEDKNWFNNEVIISDKKTKPKK